MATKYTIKQAKRDFEIGYLTRFRIERAPLDADGGWVVVLGQGIGEGPIVDVRTKQTRIFRSLDSAVSALGEIGFCVEVLA